MLLRRPRRGEAEEVGADERAEAKVVVPKVALVPHRALEPRRQLPRQLCKLLLHERRGSALARVAIVGQSLHGVGKGVASVIVYPLDGHARRKLRVVRVVRRQVRRRLGSELVNLRIRRSRSQPVNHSRRQFSGGGRDARVEAGGESSVASRELLLKRPAIWLSCERHRRAAAAATEPANGSVSSPTAKPKSRPELGPWPAQ